MEEKLTLSLGKHRCLNENFNNFPKKILIIREIFSVSDVAFELLKALLLVCDINEDDIILKLFTTIDDIIMVNHAYPIYFKDLSLFSIKKLFNTDIYFLREIGFNIICPFGVYNIKIQSLDFGFNFSFLLLKNKVKFEIKSVYVQRLSPNTAFGYNALMPNLGTRNIITGISLPNDVITGTNNT